MSNDKPENEGLPAQEPTEESSKAEAKEEAAAKKAPAKKAAAKKAPAKKAAAKKAAKKVAKEETKDEAAEEKAAEKTEAPEAKEAAPKAEKQREEAPKAKEKKESPKAEEKKDEKKPVDASKGEAGSDEDKAEENKEDTTVQDLLDDGLGDIKIRRAKGSKNVTHGIVHVVATFNNTKVTVTDQRGNVISWSSAGKCNFRGSRKSTAYAAQVVTQDATRAAMAHGLKEVEVHLKGPGLGRDSAVRALQALGIIIVSIVDKTPVPHNGCRPPKRRRV